MNVIRYIISFNLTYIAVKGFIHYSPKTENFPFCKIRHVFIITKISVSYMFKIYLFSKNNIKIDIHRNNTTISNNKHKIKNEDIFFHILTNK